MNYLILFITGLLTVQSSLAFNVALDSQLLCHNESKNLKIIANISSSKESGTADQIARLQIYSYTDSPGRNDHFQKIKYVNGNAITTDWTNSPPSGVIQILVDGNEFLKLKQLTGKQHFTSTFNEKNLKCLHTVRPKRDAQKN
jgi:hypothetical protein